MCGASKKWKNNFLWYSISYLACTFGAVLIAVNSDLVTPVSLLAAGLVVLTTYAAYRIFLGKLTPDLPS